MAAHRELAETLLILKGPVVAVPVTKPVSHCRWQNGAAAFPLDACTGSRESNGLEGK